MYSFLTIGIQNYKVYRYEKHSHDSWEITYYYEGNGINITDGIEYPFFPGTIICQPPKLAHEDISEGSYKNIFFTVVGLNLPESVPVIVHDTANKDFLTILWQLYNEYNGENEPSVINALLQVLSEYLLRYIGAHRANPYIEVLKRRIMTSLSEVHFSVQQEMEQLPVSTNHLRQLFEKEVGVSPKKYLQYIRINHAKRLLKISTYSVKDVSLLCGYDDPYYFSRIFKKCCGISPELWRAGQ